ncbi:MAG TPA: hypothetical protein VLR94_11280 [Acidobacteriota bacterium]|nr:hypothetical protein [Acidobacteriota bacterium]
MKSYFRFLILFLLFPLAMQAQSQTQTQSRPAAPPSTDIYLADIKTDGDNFNIGKPVNATPHKGYDNQPHFLADGQSFYYTSIHNGQADIYLYDLKTGTRKQITNPKESEFSPTPMPDGKYISVVRVEADATQRLWKFPLAGGEPSLVLENVKRVGYHAWVNENKVVLFILGEPDTLQVADLATGNTAVIIENIGRCLQNVPGSDRITFAQKAKEGGWYIMEWNPQTGAIRPLTAVNTDEADFVWLPDGSLLAASDSKLLRWNPKGMGWREAANLAPLLHGITRMSVSPRGDKLALVAAE